MPRAGRTRIPERRVAVRERAGGGEQAGGGGVIEAMSLKGQRDELRLGPGGRPAALD